MAIQKEYRWLWIENKIRDMERDLELIKIKLQIDDATLEKVEIPRANDEGADKDELTW